MSLRGRSLTGYPPLLLASWIVTWIINVAVIGSMKVGASR